MTRTCLLLLMVLLAGSGALGLAATDSGTANVYIAANATLTVVESAVAWGSAGNPLPGFSAGVLAPTTPAHGYLSVNARCNARTGYMIAVRATDLADGPEIIPANRLGFSLVDRGQPMGAVAYLAGPDTDLNLFAANEPKNAAGKDYDLHVRLNLDGTESAGSYSGTITLTLTY